MRCTHFLVLVLIVAGFAYGSVKAPPKLVSLAISPGGIELWGAGASQRVIVVAKFADGLERDVTAQSRLNLSNTGIAAVLGGPRLEAVADGEATFYATFGDLTVQTGIRVREASKKRGFSFARDIEAIFTRRGCNSSGCHGSVKGRAGFKLSMTGLYPREDFNWIVEGGTFSVLSNDPGTKRPRISLQEPEKSLLLLKPTMAIAHGGGRRFPVGSPDYGTILEWVKHGAPYGTESDEKNAHIEKLEVFPRSVIIDIQGRQQLIVRARLSNGHYEDVTGEILYASNNTAVADVSSDGLVKAAAAGETVLMLLAAGASASVNVGVIRETLPSYPTLTARNFIDEHVFAKLRRFQIVPSESAGDSEFLRRVCLDLTGTLPPPERVREFVASRDPNKRDEVIEALLQTPEFVDYWTYRLADLFRVNEYTQGGPKYASTYWQWIHDSIASGKPYDQIARERIAALGMQGGTRHYFSKGGELRLPQDIMAEQVRVFLGRRLDCAQCHNHPYENWSSNQFWSLAAFFGRLTRLGQADLPMVYYDDPAGHGEFGQGAKVFHPRTKVEVQPAFLDGRPLPDSQLERLRSALAGYVTSHPWFSEAAVNRIWSYFFGHGIVNPVDDFRSTNPPTHPELLEALANDFRKHEHDLKRLIRVIVQSRAYQLSSTPNATNRSDRTNYSHALSRSLDAEVLLDAICQVTNVEETFENSLYGRALAGTRAINLDMPDIYPSQFLDVFGRDNRVAVPERNAKPNLGQALHMIAGETYTTKILSDAGRLRQLLNAGAPNEQIIEEFYLAALSRKPSNDELTEAASIISRRSDRLTALSDLVWAILSSREFAYNH